MTRRINNPDKNVIRSQIDTLIKRHIDRTLSTDEDERIMNTEPPDYDYHKDHAKTLGMIRDVTRGKLAANDISWITETVDSLLEAEGIIMDSSSKAYRMLCREMLKADDFIFKTIEKRHQGDYSDDPQFELPRVGQRGQEPEPEPTSISLSKLADQYELDKRGSWSPSAINKWKGIRKVFFRFYDPSTHAHTITRKVFYEYRELLRCLPKAFMTTKKYNEMTADDVRALDIPNPINPKTVNAHVIFLHGMFKLGVNLEYIDKNPASDMQVPIKGDARKLRDMFTPSELEVIFKSPEIKNAKYSYQFWVTILSLFTGARREELCSLYKEDIKQEDGVWYINITADKPDKRIKTYQIRTVPLHSFVLELGFLEYVQNFQKGQRLWPELNNNNRDKKYGHYYGRWFNNRLLKPLNIKPTAAEKDKGAALKDHHSFRHTLINVGIRAGMDVMKVKGMVGHKEKGVTFGTYFKGFTVKQIYDEIVSQIDHGVDLNHLKEHGFIKP